MKAEQIKPALRECIAFQLASKSMEPISENEKLSDAINRALEKIPQVKYIEQSQYLKNIMLPKIAKNRGNNSSEYKFYFGVFESLMFAIRIIEREQTYRRMISQEKLYNEFLKKRVLFLEKELMRYTTMDDLTTKELTEELFARNSTGV